MSRWELTIHLKSGLAAGSGVGSPGDVDRDIVHDEYGLPYLPGKRIKGLLRDAYRDVFDTGAFPDMPAVEKLFGETGGASSGPVDFGDAHVRGSDQIRAWLANRPPQIHARDVVNFYSHRVRQTAMDPTRGAPLKNTLRATRLLNGGRSFSTTLTANSPEAEAWFEHLQRAAKAIQSAGIARSRGWGELQCELIPEERSNAAQGSLETAERDEQGSPAGNPSTGVLRYRLQTRRAVMAPARTSDPNTVRSEDYLPGSLMIGVCAQRLNNDAGKIHQLLLSDDVRFLPAYPVNSKNVVTEPFPHSLRALKSVDNEYLDLAERDPSEPLRREGRWPQAGASAQREIHLHEVERVLHYHHSRARDRRIGRAVGEEAGKYPNLDRSEAGELFVYEAIAAGQMFEGEIHGPADKLEEIRKLLDKQVTGITLGRSRNAQYGGEATLTWCAANTGRTRASGESGLGDKIVVTLLSDLVNVNENGHPAAVFPELELSTALDGVGLTLEKSFTRTAWGAGYLSHQRLARQQTLCLRAGSVFVFTGSSNVEEESLAKAENQSYGLRTNEGFGRIRLVRKGWEDPKVASQRPAKIPKKIGDDHPAHEIAAHAYQLYVREEAVAEGRDLARVLLKSEAEAIAKISPSVLQRLYGIFKATELEVAEAQLKKLRDLAKKPLERVWLAGTKDNKRVEITLYDLLLGLCRVGPPAEGDNEASTLKQLSGKAYAEGIERGVWASDTTRWKAVFQQKPASLPAEELVKLYVHSLLRSLMIEKRKVREPQAQKKGGAK